MLNAVPLPVLVSRIEMMRGSPPYVFFRSFASKRIEVVGCKVRFSLESSIFLLMTRVSGHLAGWP